MTTVSRERITVAAEATTGGGRKRRRFPWYAYVLLFPLFAVLGVFSYYPAAAGMFWSFFDWQPAAQSTYSGLANYSTMLGDSLWWQSFRNLGIIFVFGVVSWVIPLVAAELVVSLRSERAQFLFRTLLIVPMAFPGVVTALIWSFMYDPNAGFFNSFLRAVGLGALAHNWTGDPSTALLALLFVGFPFIAGLPFLIFYSSLSNIPNEVRDAAQIDGVGRIGRIWRIDIPLMASQVRVLFFLAVVGTLQYGFVAYLVTAGGPDNATSVPVLRMIGVAFTGGDWGYAAALSTTLFLITLVVSGAVVVARRRDGGTADGGEM